MTRIMGFMEQPISGFYRDSEGDWVARLACGHGQHVRHQPPFVNRPWVTTEAGRKERLGQRLDCLKCDRGEPVDGLPLSGSDRASN